jgi:hypothetical protein
MKEKDAEKEVLVALPGKYMKLVGCIWVWWVGGLH